jgi:hypothetical protein
MKLSEFFLLTVAIALGAFAALAIWSVIVKTQVQAQLANNSSIGSIAGLLR